MTAKTSQVLADALRAAGAEDLAKRAERDEFHDFFGPHTTPQLILLQEINNRLDDKSISKVARKRLRTICDQILEGEHDASKEESDEWANSLEGQETFRELMTRK